MPISPIVGASQAEAIARIYADAETRLLQRMAANLARGIDNPAWEVTQLGRLQAMRRETLQILAQSNRAAAVEIARSVNSTYQSGITSALKDSHKLATGLAATTAQQRAAVDALVSDTLRGITAQQGAILRKVDDVYREVVSKTTAQVVAGSITRKAAAQEAMSALLSKGITSVPTARGSMDLATYTSMAVRTATARSALQGHLDTMANAGLDLVTIQPGPRPCDICDGWAGLILTTNGQGAGSYQYDDIGGDGQVTVDVDADLEDAREAGWGHPNCRCNLSTYLPGISTVDTNRPPWDQEGYEAQQQQRAIERQIRAAKNEQAIAITPEAKAAADAKVKGWQAEMRTHLDEHDYLKRQSAREGLGSGLGFGESKPPGGFIPDLPKGPNIPEPPSPAAWLDGLTKLDKAETLEEATTALTANPGNILKTRDYTANCSNVVQAVELRARGLDVVADARVGGSDAEIAGEWLKPDGTPAKFKYVTGPKTIQGTKLVQAIVDEEEWPPGARGYVTIQWTGGGAHIFNMAVDDAGKLRFYEGQVDSTDAVVDYFKNRRRGSALGVMRVDHLTPTDAVKRRLVTVGSPEYDALLDKAAKAQAEADALAKRKTEAKLLNEQIEAQVAPLVARTVELGREAESMIRLGKSHDDPNIQRISAEIDKLRAQISALRARKVYL